MNVGELRKLIAELPDDTPLVGFDGEAYPNPYYEADSQIEDLAVETVRFSKGPRAGSIKAERYDGPWTKRHEKNPELYVKRRVLSV